MGSYRFEVDQRVAIVARGQYEVVLQVVAADAHTFETEDGRRWYHVGLPVSGSANRRAIPLSAPVAFQIDRITKIRYIAEMATLVAEMADQSSLITMDDLERTERLLTGLLMRKKSNDGDGLSTRIRQRLDRAAQAGLDRIWYDTETRRFRARRTEDSE